MTEADRSWTRGCVLAFLTDAFTELWDPAEMNANAVKDSLSPFLSWLHTLRDDVVFGFCWKLLRYDRTFTPEPVLWLKRFRTAFGRQLVGKHSPRRLDR